MQSNGRSSVERLLALARQGGGENVGRLLELYRNYLLLIARTQIDLHLRGRFDPSDLVQEAFVEACRAFPEFHGTTEAELLGWLRQLLVHRLATMVQREVLTQKRDVRREVPLDRRLAAFDQSSAQVEAALVGRLSSPSAEAQRRERAVIIADILADFPRDRRDVIVMRNLEGLAFPEIAHRMGRSAGAVRVLWVRAVDQLRQTLEQQGWI